MSAPTRSRRKARWLAVCAAACGALLAVPAGAATGRVTTHDPYGNPHRVAASATLAPLDDGGGDGDPDGGNESDENCARTKVPGAHLSFPPLVDFQVTGSMAYGEVLQHPFWRLASVPRTMNDQTR